MKENCSAKEGGGGPEQDFSIHLLMLFCSMDDPAILDHHTHNEILNISALGHLRTIANAIRECSIFALE